MRGSSIHHLRDDIAIVGWACRLPGAKSVDELWSLLLEARCAISRVPPDRFPLDALGHPRRRERGKSYTWAAGILDDIWGFDPAVFRISPREAVQLDPQQRILLQLTWEALEDAGIVPSSIAGTDVGVFIGASQTDYGHAFFSDPAIADAYFAPGTALAVLANRISHIYGLHGPSITVDTACSSSLVALHQAVEALRSGRIDTAIVGGSNLIASPASFIAFSQANMLSPVGLCQAFSASADGFVRAEGAVVFVLRKANHAQARQNPIHGLVVASDVNSDGRTNGISLPSVDAQEALLSRIYARHGVDPDHLAFVEAHGTGTPVGDPVEATAIGRSIGQKRSSVLPIGSIKSNIGHLEPASGLAGVLKAVLALNHGLLPPSLHFSEPNPHIDFDGLNINVCSQPQLLSKSGERYAGVNSFGFGGTNAHAVVAGERAVARATAEQEKNDCEVFALSANCSEALVALARDYAERVSELADHDTATVASAIVHRRQRQSHRAVISSTNNAEVVAALEALAAKRAHPKLTTGTSIGEDLPVAFVYSGNGGQWAGMGLAAYRSSAMFRTRFEQIDGYFKQIGGWSLKEAIFDEALHERLPLTSIAQPLIFAIQNAATSALRAKGLQPAAVLGHSVGEVAAAAAAGILDLRTAVKVIHFRSSYQERVHGAGRMGAVLAPAETVTAMIKDIAGLEIAAINGPRAVTVAGPAAALAAFERRAKEQGIAVLDLDLDYPFHTALMAPIEAPLKADLIDIHVHDADIPFVSTVTGTCLPGSRLDGNYWWRNVRELVRFKTAVLAAAELGARYFLEIGPRPTLLKHITESLQGEVSGFAANAALDRSDEDGDPFDKARAHAMVSGARIDIAKIFGPDPGPSVSLPTYPWQQTSYRFKPTVEAIIAETEHHPFAGARRTGDSLVWWSHIDTTLFPELADHRLGEQTIFPGTGFVEIALAVARQWLQHESVILADFVILNPLDLTSGETREVMTRVSPGSNTLEIFSRPRLSLVSWLPHCRCKVQRGNAAGTASGPARPQDGRSLSPSAIYDIAGGSGLHYGPAFRLADNVTVHDADLISVELGRPAEETPFVLDPMRFDSCAHGFFALFPALRAGERGVAYIPVRLEEIALYRPHVMPKRALIEVISKSERSIVANCYIYSENDEIIAVVRRIRSQAVPAQRMSSLDAVSFVALPQLIDGTIVAQTGAGLSAHDIVAAADSLGALASDIADSTEPEMLIEGWAMAAAYEIAAGLAENGIVDVDMLAGSGRIPETMRDWVVNLLGSLAAADLAKEDAASWTLVKDTSLPRSEWVVKTLAAEQQSYAAETLLAAAVSSFATQMTSGAPAAREPGISRAAIDFYTTTSIGLREASDALFRILSTSKRSWPTNRALRVLQIGFAPLTHALFSQRDILLTVFEPDRRRYESAELALSRHREVRLVDAEHSHELGDYDLIVSVAGLHRLPSTLGLAALKSKLAPDGAIVAIEPRPSLFKDLVFGLDAGWFMPTRTGRPVSPLRPLASWPALMNEAGFHNPDARVVRYGNELGYLIVAEAARDRSAVDPVAAPQLALASDKTLVLVSPQVGSELAERLKVSMASSGWSLSIIDDLAHYPSAASNIVVLGPEIAGHTNDAVAVVTERCLTIKACAEKINNGAPATLWLLFAGALATTAPPVNPVETAAWAFSRTLANEFPKLDVRRIDVAPGLSAEAAARQIHRIVASETKDTELQIDEHAVRAVRVMGLRRALEAKASPHHTSLTLQRRSATGQRLVWEPTPRRRPAANEVEIEVEAAGLNFRDLMWSLSLLPDDMLEDGLSGPTLGLECAGRIVRTGPDVKTLAVGDRVMLFAPSSFATHLTVQSNQAVKLPEQIACPAAATIPVAFFTAYYALVTVAKLARREWVLIHGGAGAVGMAAIQVAQSRGARIIATAGSPAKRNLLRALGVPHVLDSRSTAFADEVRKITGDGVDVVLNSLAGDAMERSIVSLRPFGRFIELGKRDYVSNTHIGLRPFRKNLSYFGVDVDQVFASRKAQSARIFSQIVKQFANGKFVPLPYSVFDGDNVAAAFHLMQQSGHIGKIVVRPPAKGLAAHGRRPFQVNAKGTHVVTGAFGGFGMETAKWLVDKGARHLVLIGRKGAVTDEAKALLRDFAARGVKVIAQPCDVSDRSALEQLFEVIHATMPPVVGVIHAAMVLDDGILANLDAERFRRVLAPKVAGAENLDTVVRGESLEYFVLFSSVTTLIGNPGQANYVAANAYMEGLARRRRQKGLPALAIGWGPILDVGAVARDQKLQSGLQKITGATGLRAREALDLMAQALGQLSEGADTAVITISPSEGTFGADRLAVLRSPTYEAFVGATHRLGESDAERIDLHALAASDGVESARRKIADVISARLANVLHLREEDISRVRPLGEIGLDSLMALELVMNLEDCFGIQIPLSGASGAMTVADIADQIIAHIGLDRDRDDAVITTLAEQHRGGIDPAQLKVAKELLHERPPGARRLLS